MRPKTLLELAGAPVSTTHLTDAVLIVIDAQREYVDGKLPLSGMEPALTEIGSLLARAQGRRSDHSYQASRASRRGVRTGHPGI
jgi:hypothetical protein